MRNILYDLTSCQSVGKFKNHGGKEYAEAVFMEFMRRNISISGIYNSQEYINPLFVEYCKINGDLYDVNCTSLQKVIDTGKYNVFYSPLPYSYHNINWGDVIFAGNIHGLRLFDAFTDKYEFKYSLTVKEKSMSLLKRIPFVKKKIISIYKKNIYKILNNPSFVCITGSNHSKYLLLSLFPTVSEDRIKVFCDPLELEDVTSHNTSENDKYYLMVSANRWVKNVYRGILALDDLMSSGRLNTKVIITGYDSALNFASKLKNKDKFIFKGYVTSEELASLYKNAYCLLFLSLSEGFGYPPLEAMSRGVPVICSPLTAIYEVYQNGVLYCNPLSIDDIKIKILEMENTHIREEYVAKGVSRSGEIINQQKQDLVQLVDYISSL